MDILHASSQRRAQPGPAGRTRYPCSSLSQREVLCTLRRTHSVQESLIYKAKVARVAAVALFASALAGPAMKAAAEVAFKIAWDTVKSAEAAKKSAEAAAEQVGTPVEAAQCSAGDNMR